jgi:hypothetical protein
MSKKDKPTHDAYVAVSTGPNPTDTIWLKVGAAWEHKDGEGFNVVLHATPVTGKLVLRKPKEKSDDIPEGP